MWNPIPRTSGILGGKSLLLAGTLLIGLTGCFYTFQAGAGLPSHVRTLAVIPFDNDTGRFEITQEIQNRLLEELPRTFGVTVAGEEHADAVVRGTIRNYSVEAPSFRAGDRADRTEVVERQVNVTVEIQVVDRVGNVILWENRNLTARGEYLEASQLEEDGRQQAINRLAQAVIDGLQSNW